MTAQDRTARILKHYEDYFGGHRTKMERWEQGPINAVVPGFEVFCAEPGPVIGLWTYCSIGASRLWHDQSGLMEFVIHAQDYSIRIVELLAMTTHYHARHDLGFGHTLPIGEPWLPGSYCDYWLVSKPYPLGPEFEICGLGDTHAHVAWMLPITECERNYGADHGLEALEQKFEDAGLKYWEVGRESVV
ncbi:suppressor of fused domain protein [Pelagibius sp.]|uniref:suppressor of fused domain protein n=1 Tax=Pelagibius sp. TaxID=1931238 RepID=UPI0026068793|nr:suppressor of fused domain protein [Pelagibius sp.]